MNRLLCRLLSTKDSDILRALEGESLPQFYIARLNEAGWRDIGDLYDTVWLENTNVAALKERFPVDFYRGFSQEIAARLVAMPSHNSTLLTFFANTFMSRGFTEEETSHLLGSVSGGSRTSGVYVNIKIVNACFSWRDER